jgi:hypothetical protein
MAGAGRVRPRSSQSQQRPPKCRPAASRVLIEQMHGPRSHPSAGPDDSVYGSMAPACDTSSLSTRTHMQPAAGGLLLQVRQSSFGHSLPTRPFPVCIQQLTKHSPAGKCLRPSPPRLRLLLYLLLLLQQVTRLGDHGQHRGGGRGLRRLARWGEPRRYAPAPRRPRRLAALYSLLLLQLLWRF